MICLILFVIWFVGIFKAIGMTIDPEDPPSKFGDFVIIFGIGIVWPIIFVVTMIQCIMEDLKNK